MKVITLLYGAYIFGVTAALLPEWWDMLVGFLAGIYFVWAAKKIEVSSC